MDTATILNTAQDYLNKAHLHDYEGDPESTAERLEELLRFLGSALCEAGKTPETQHKQDVNTPQP